MITKLDDNWRDEDGNGIDDSIDNAREMLFSNFKARARACVENCACADDTSWSTLAPWMLMMLMILVIR